MKKSPAMISASTLNYSYLKTELYNSQNILNIKVYDSKLIFGASHRVNLILLFALFSECMKAFSDILGVGFEELPS